VTDSPANIPASPIVPTSNAISLTSANQKRGAKLRATSSQRSFSGLHARHDSAVSTPTLPAAGKTLRFHGDRDNCLCRVSRDVLTGNRGEQPECSPCIETIRLHVPVTGQFHPLTTIEFPRLRAVATDFPVTPILPRSTWKWSSPSWSF
jgi:hypothetical protein